VCSNRQRGAHRQAAEGEAGTSECSGAKNPDGVDQDRVNRSAELANRRQSRLVDCQKGFISKPGWLSMSTSSLQEIPTVFDKDLRASQVANGNLKEMAVTLQREAGV